jgi:leucine dehydrogenase
VSDVDPERVQTVVREHGARAVPPAEIFDVEADVFSPCALGAVLDDVTIGRLRVEIVAGAANNQLAEERHGGALASRGILWAPDYVINAGGVISVCGELQGWGPEVSREKARRIGDTLLEVFRRARADEVTPAAAADAIARARLTAGKKGAGRVTP